MQTFYLLHRSKALWPTKTNNKPLVARNEWPLGTDLTVNPIGSIPVSCQRWLISARLN